MAEECLGFCEAKPCLFRCAAGVVDCVRTLYTNSNSALYLGTRSRSVSSFRSCVRKNISVYHFFTFMKSYRLPCPFSGYPSPTDQGLSFSPTTDCLRTGRVQQHVIPAKHASSSRLPTSTKSPLLFNTFSVPQPSNPPPHFHISAISLRYTRQLIRLHVPHLPPFLDQLIFPSTHQSHSLLAQLSH